MALLVDRRGLGRRASSLNNLVLRPLVSAVRAILTPPCHGVTAPIDQTPGPRANPVTEG